MSGEAQVNQAPEAVTADASRKPKWLNPVVVTAMVVGSLFGCCGITSVGGAIIGRNVPQATLEMQATNAKDPAVAETIQRYAATQKAFQERTFPLTMTIAVLGLFQSIALVISGVLANRLRPIGRRMLAGVCVVGIGIELIGACTALYLSSETSAYAENLMKATLAAKQRQQPALDESSRAVVEKIGAGAARAGSVLGVIMVLGFFVLKVAYYVSSTLYLRRREVIDYFDNVHAPTAFNVDAVD
jgi:hypothetical protein